MSEISSFLGQSRDRVNAALNRLLTHQQSPFSPAGNPLLERLQSACHYSISNGGKRLRPALVYATAHTLNSRLPDDELDQIAAAVECIHSYSLVHDDLPAMDDDKLRRGKPTCHIAYDEPTAILVGDGLQAFAFELLCTLPSLNSSLQIKMVQLLAQAAGSMGMVGGQMIDLDSENQAIDINTLEYMHKLKTGALIRASVGLGGLAAEADDSIRTALDQFAGCIGLAFQVQDDILDIESDTNTLGKQQGADMALNKPTYPSLLGMERAKLLATELTTKAHSTLASISADCRLLHELADFIVTRNH